MLSLLLGGPSERLLVRPAAQEKAVSAVERTADAQNTTTLSLVDGRSSELPFVVEGELRKDSRAVALDICSCARNDETTLIDDATCDIRGAVDSGTDLSIVRDDGTMDDSVKRPVNCK